MAKIVKSVNRPPTPEPEDLAQERTLEEDIEYKLVASGERERLRALLRDKLTECGWRDDIKTAAREVVKSRGRENVTVEDIVRTIKPAGRQAVPDHVKAELLKQIRAFIVAV